MLNLLLPLFILSIALPNIAAKADTLSPCGWRGTRTLRCYEETNGIFGKQSEERYWEGGVEEMENFKSQEKQ